jgi:hypothetical protein
VKVFINIYEKELAMHEFFVKSEWAANLLANAGFTVVPFTKSILYEPNWDYQYEVLCTQSGWLMSIPENGYSKNATRNWLKQFFGVKVSAKELNIY